jgi:hypothetical protein
MSQRAQWKMLHLLHLYGNDGIDEGLLAAAGIHCRDDTMHRLFDAGSVLLKNDGRYRLAPAVRHVLDVCVVANRVWPGEEMRIDYPEVFVVMPFSEPWSQDVFEQAIRPGVEVAGCRCVRGDTVVRVGDLSRNIWNAILQAGIIIVDVTVPNPNVFYELGLVHALGKDVIMVRQRGVKMPADIAGAHYCEYDLANPAGLASWLTDELKRWAAEREIRAEGVRELEQRV